MSVASYRAEAKRCQGLCSWNVLIIKFILYCLNFVRIYAIAVCIRMMQKMLERVAQEAPGKGQAIHTA